LQLYVKYIHTMKKLILVFILGLSMSMGANAQYLEYGLGVGGAVYWGDLNTPDFNTNLRNTKFAAQGMAKLNFSKYFAAKANLLVGKLAGDDSRSFIDWQKQRNLNFESTLIELAVLGEFHVFGYNFGEENPISPYVTAGVGGFYFNPTTIYQGDKIELQPLGTEGQGLPGRGAKYSRVALSVPFGAGAKFQIKHLGIGWESS